MNMPRMCLTLDDAASTIGALLAARTGIHGEEFFARVTAALGIHDGDIGANVIAKVGPEVFLERLWTFMASEMSRPACAEWIAAQPQAPAPEVRP